MPGHHVIVADTLIGALDGHDEESTDTDTLNMPHQELDTALLAHIAKVHVQILLLAAAVRQPVSSLHVLGSSEAAVRNCHPKQKLQLISSGCSSSLSNCSQLFFDYSSYSTCALTSYESLQTCFQDEQKYEYSQRAKGTLQSQRLFTENLADCVQSTHWRHQACVFHKKVRISLRVACERNAHANLRRGVHLASH